MWWEPAGYLGLFAAVVATGLGLPVPEDAVVLAGGLLVHRGATRLLPTMAVALVGVLAGDVALYLAGRRYGRRVMAHRRWQRLFTPARLERAERFFVRYGLGAVLLGRFVMGLRAAVFLTAGTLRMSFPRFFLVNLVGALASVPLLVWLGDVGGAQIGRLTDGVAHLRLILLGAALLAGAIVTLVILIRRKSPRAK